MGFPRSLKGASILWIALICLLAAPTRGLERSSFQDWQLRGLELMEEKGQTILKISGSRSGAAQDYLFLGFDQETPNFLRDLSGNFRVQESEYVRVPDSRGGTGSALFNRRKSGVILESPPELWPGSGPMESFQISFHFKVAYLYRRNELLSRTGFLDGYKRGLEILIEDGYLRIGLQNLFQDLDRNTHSYELRSSQRIVLDRWYLLQFNYNASSGKLTLLLNGQEQEVAFARTDGQVLRAVNPAMDRSPIKIAGQYSGWMDELRISPLGSDRTTMSAYDAAEYDPLSGRIYQQRSVALSPVMSYHKPLQSMDLGFTGQEPPGSMLSVEYRISEERFSPTLGEHVLPFKRLKSPSRIPWDGPAYVQWRVLMQASPSGDKSPFLSSLKLNANPVPTPSRPTGLRIVRELSNDRQICLEWNQNPESSVEKHGGYRIHIGPRSGEFVAILEYNREKKRIRNSTLEFPLTERERLEQKARPQAIRRLKQQKVRFMLDRALIERNRIWLNRREAYPLLEPGRAYYLVISAYIHPDAPSAVSSQIVHLLRN
ncbi:MAG: hypothetical protein CMF59_08995 [Leptospiraceae bacterium]|nr:hypothetical protein [Leptospiraceae bacterium]